MGITHEFKAFIYLRRLKVLLTSRKLFRNWFSAGVRYYLTKVGLLRVDGIGVVCGDGSRGLIPVGVYGVLVNDYYDGYITNYDCREGIATYVNNVHLPIEKIRESNGFVRLAVESGWAYDVAGKYWFKDGMKFRHMHWPILEVFDFGNYEGIDVNGKVVIDVGAFVGDTAMYFILRGARRVIAVEPHPGAYAEMLDNVKLNNLERVIVPVNAGLASKPGKICIEDVSVEATSATYHGSGNCINAVPAVTLSELISRFNIDVGNAVLKMDCEGCEFDIILNDYDHVRLFRELIFEYHPRFVNKSLDDLLNVLGRDYKCDIRGNEDLGIMHCIRK
jgi:FkbM family methyltransferase